MSNDHQVEVSSTKIYKWAGIAIVSLIILVAIIVIPFMVTHTGSKILIYLLIGVVVVILIGTIISTEWLRRNSQRNRPRQTSDDRSPDVDEELCSSIEYRNCRSDTPKKRRNSVRSSWTFWPRRSQKNKPSAPPFETEV